MKKSVTNTARACLELWNVGLFALVWMFYYNKFAFDTYHMLGGAVSIFIYFIIYNALCALYKAFRIASCPVGETVFSQIIAFGIPDLILYVESCLIFNHLVNIGPGVGIVCLQMIGSLLIIIGAKRYFKYRVPPKNTIFIYGKDISEEEVWAFKERILKKYAHIFHVASILSEEEEEAYLRQQIRECHTVLFYEVSYHKRSMLAEYCLQERKEIYFTPRLEDIVLMGCQPKHLLDTPLFRYDYVHKKKTEYALKRFFDIVFALIFTVIVSPFMALTALAIKIEDRGPVFYKQRRCTKDAREFDILKFRSMVVDAEKDGCTPCISGDKRITRVGKVIRAARIDELPQIFNILKGDMSFVGPRPERVEHVQKYTEELPEFAYRMRVKGGLTGYAQIYGKYNTSAYDKLRLDLLYIENQSFLLDLKLLMLTFKVMFIPESTEGFTEEKSKLLSAEKQNVVTVSQYADIKSKLNVKVGN